MIDRGGEGGIWLLIYTSISGEKYSKPHSQSTDTNDTASIVVAAYLFVVYML